VRQPKQIDENHIEHERGRREVRKRKERERERASEENVVSRANWTKKSNSGEKQIVDPTGSERGEKNSLFHTSLLMITNQIVIRSRADYIEMTFDPNISKV
jgi:hypothetical protein